MTHTERTLISLILVLTILLFVMYLENRELRKTQDKSKMVVNQEGELVEK